LLLLNYAAFLPHSRAEAISAPSRNELSFVQTTSSAIHCQSTQLPKPQSTPGDDALGIAGSGDDGFDALRDHLGVLDELALRIAHAGNEDHPVGQLGLADRRRLVGRL
jgi:hypothetical protein